MKNKMFDFRLYLQGIKRLRVIGLALAILCVVASPLIPIDTWIDQPEGHWEDEIWLDGEEAVVKDASSLVESGTKGKYEAAGAQFVSTYVPPSIGVSRLMTPVVAVSYFSPIFILILFSYLNKRRESDFYHAIPATRVCVYNSFVAAALTWMWSILTLGTLASALVCTLCPYVTFSFGKMLEVLMACWINAGFLAAITAVAVALTGTLGMSILATGLLLCSCRASFYVLQVALEVNCFRVIQVNGLWRGFLEFRTSFPFALLSGNTGRNTVIYGICLTVVLFVLGGWLYHRRHSEVAAHAVTGRLVHRLWHLLISVPLFLIVTYAVLYNPDTGTLLMLSAAALLAFYLYELLTTKQAKRMLRVTPWLGVVLCFCVLFVGVIHTTAWMDQNERTDSSRIRSVTLLNGPNLAGEDLPNGYELSQILGSASDDPAVLELVSEVWAGTQLKNSASFQGEIQVCYARIQLRSGRTVKRRLFFTNENYIQMMKHLKADLQPDPIPEDEDITKVVVGLDVAITVTGEWQQRIMQALRADYAAGKVKNNGYSSAHVFPITIYYEDGLVIYGWERGMENVFDVLYELNQLPAYRRQYYAQNVVNTLKKATKVTIGLYLPKDPSYVGYRNTQIRESEAKELLYMALKRREAAEGEQVDECLFYFSFAEPYASGLVSVLLTAEEYDALVDYFCQK